MKETLLHIRSRSLRQEYEREGIPSSQHASMPHPGNVRLFRKTAHEIPDYLHGVDIGGVVQEIRVRGVWSVRSVV